MEDVIVGSVDASKLLNILKVSSIRLKSYLMSGEDFLDFLNFFWIWIWIWIWIFECEMLGTGG